jgi:hypothetical protein
LRNYWVHSVGLLAAWLIVLTEPHRSMTGRPLVT